MNFKDRYPVKRRSRYRENCTTFCSAFVLIYLLWGGTCQATTYAYVPNSGTDTLSVFRTSDNALVKTIAVGQGPYGAAVSQDGNYAYVTNMEDGTVSVINTSDNEVSDTVTVGISPMGIAADPDGQYVYVANNGDDTVSVISTEDDDENTVIATIQVGKNPYAIAVDPDSDYVYVTNNGDNTVSVISTSDDTATVTVGQGPLGVATDPDGDYVYVTNTLDNTVSVISIEGDNQDEDDDDEDEDDNRVVATVSVGNSPWGVAVVQNDDAVYVANSGDDTVSVISTSDRTVSSTLSVGDEPLGVAAPKNGDVVYVVNRSDETISVIDTSDDTIQTISTGEGTAPAALGDFIGGWAPEAPDGLTIEDTSDDSIELSWTDNSYDEMGFKIERREYYDDDDEFDQVAVVGSNVTSYTDGGLSSVTTYEYRIRAYNESSDSDYSDSVYDETDEDDSSSISCFIGATSADRHLKIPSGILLALLFFPISMAAGYGVRKIFFRDKSFFF